jgi:hypothetical protein
VDLKENTISPYIVDLPAVGCFTTGKPASLLSKAATSGISEGMLGSFFLDYLGPTCKIEVDSSIFTFLVRDVCRVDVFHDHTPPVLDDGHIELQDS